MYKVKGSLNYVREDVIGYFGSNYGSPDFARWELGRGYEQEWLLDVCKTYDYLKPGEYYIIARTNASDLYDYSFTLDSWDRYNINRPK